MKIKHFVLIVIFCLTSISVLNAQGKNTPGNQIIDQIIAVVGNQVVLHSEIEEQYLQMQARGMSTNTDQKCEIFEQLLLQNLLVAQAQIDSVEATDKEVESEINSRMEYFLRQFNSEKAMEEYFGKSIPEIKASFFDPVKDQLIARKMQQEITKDIKITPSEVKKFFAQIPVDSLPIIEATYEFSQIVKKPQMSKEENQAQIDKLNEIRNRIVNKGEDFKTLAVLYSDDPGSARNGGLMTDVGRGDLVPEFASAVFNLEIDEVSEIVDTEYGKHIIKLIGRKGDKVDFRHILLTPKYSSSAKMKAKEYLDSIANVIRTDTLTFGQAAQLYSDDETTRLNDGIVINPNTGTGLFEAKQIDPSINYVLRDLKVGEISTAFEAKDQTNSNPYKIIYLRNFTKAHTVNMKDDYQMIQDMALEDKKQKEIAKWVSEKQNDNYIKIEGNYKNCKFNFPGWVK